MKSKTSFKSVQNYYYIRFRNESTHPFQSLEKNFPKVKNECFHPCYRQAISYLATVYIHHFAKHQILEVYWQANQEIFTSFIDKESVSIG